MTSKPILIIRVKGQADSEHFGILWDIIVHNGHIEGELTHIITEWTQTEVGEGTIVTGSYIWMKLRCVCCMCVCVTQLDWTQAIVSD